MCKKSIILAFVLLAFVGLSLHAQSFMLVSGQVGAKDYLTTINGGRSMIGVEGGVGGGYELRLRAFLLHVELGLTAGTAAFDMDNDTRSFPAIDSEGQSFTYNYIQRDRVDRLSTVNVQLPVMVGFHLRRFYALGGVKLQVSMMGRTRQKAIVSSEGDYGVFVDPFANMPDHMFYNGQKLVQKNSISLSPDILVSGEIGVRLGRVPHGTGYDVPRPTRQYRLALFADYGLRDYRKNDNLDIISLPTSFDSSVSAAELNSVIRTTRVENAIHNLTVGVKFTMLFQLPEHRSCVLCKD